jgi:hypothetical protein
MRKLKIANHMSVKTRRYLALSLTLSVIMTLFGQQKKTTINPAFAGFNYWLTSYSLSPVTAPVTVLNNTVWSLLKNTEARLMRVGGKGYNASGYLKAPFTGSFDIVPSGYVKIVDDIREKGFEPIITVSFRDKHQIKSIAEQAESAAEVVRVLNIVHNRHIKFFIVGNEPGLDQEYYGIGSGSAQQPEDIYRIRDYIRKYSVEMKKVDPTIMIIGPEGEYDDDFLFEDDPLNNNNSLCSDPTTPGNNSIMGTIPVTFEGVSTGSASGKYYIDYLSYHAYSGFSNAFTTTYSLTSQRRQAYIETGYSYINKFAGTYTNYINNGYYNRTGSLKIVIDEFNMSGGSGSAASAASYTADTRDANTFLSGQLVVDMMCGMMAAKEGSVNPNTCPIAFCNVWSPQESGTDYGLIHSSTSNIPKPTYWHFYLMSKYFKGEFYSNTQAPPAIGSGLQAERGMKAYACSNEQYTAVLVMNQMAPAGTFSAVDNPLGAGSYTFEINFNNSNPNANNCADFKFDMQLGWNNFNASLENKSTSLFFFNCSGSLICRYDLKESDMVANVSTSYSPTVSSGSLPTPWSISNPGTVNCASGTTSVTLTGPATSNTWYQAPDFINSQGSSSTRAVKRGLHVCTVSTSTCASGGIPTSYATVVHETSPILKKNNPVANICSGASTVISVSTVSANTVTWTPSTGLSTTTSNTVTASPSTNQVYTVTVSSSAGCTSTDQVTVLSTNTVTSDLFIRDDISDIGTEPYNTLNWWSSPDVWVDTSPTVSASNSLSTAQYTTDGTPSYIHCIITNSGSATATGVLKLYWSKASTGQAWTTNWINYSTFGTSICSTLELVSYGDQIGTEQLVTVPANSAVQAITPWYPPDWHTFTTAGTVQPGWVQQHTCILARIETGYTTSGMRYAEGVNVTSNTYSNNNIAGRNIILIDAFGNKNGPEGGDGYDRFGLINAVIVHNIDPEVQTTQLDIQSLTNANGDDIFDYADVYIHLPADIYGIWTTGGSLGTNVEDLGNNKIKLTGSNASLENMEFDADQSFEIGVQVLFKQQSEDEMEFEFDLIQTSVLESESEVIGGVRFIVFPAICPDPPVVVERNIESQPECEVIPEVDAIEEVTYVWYDESGAVVDTGSVIHVFPEATTYYIVRAFSNGCVQSDTVFVHIVEGLCGGRARQSGITGTKPIVKEIYNIFKIIPNPSQDNATIRYSLIPGEQGFLQLTNIQGQVLRSEQLDNTKNEVTLDNTELASGVYYVSLTSSSKKLKVVKMIIMK